MYAQHFNLIMKVQLKLCIPKMLLIPQNMHYRLGNSLKILKLDYFFQLLFEIIILNLLA